MRNNLIYRNPALNSDMIDGIPAVNGEVMTVKGTMQKLMFSVLLMFMGAAYVWDKLSAGFTDYVNMITGVSLITVLILGFVIIFKRNSEVIKYLVPAYALGEGFLIGNISCLVEKAVPGTVTQAIAGTILCVLVMLGLYYYGIIKVTDKFRAVMFTAITTIFGIYMLDLIMSLFHFNITFLHSSTPLGIVFSIVVIGVLSFNLMTDFDFIERLSMNVAPKHLEWYGVFGVLVSVIWLYIEILQLLAKFNSRR